MNPILYLKVPKISALKESLLPPSLSLLKFKVPFLQKSFPFVIWVGCPFLSGNEHKRVRTKDECGRNSPTNLPTENPSKPLKLMFNMPIPCKHFFFISFSNICTCVCVCLYLSCFNVLISPKPKFWYIIWIMLYV